MTSVHNLANYCLTIYFNIILQSMLKTSKISFSFIVQLRVTRVLVCVCARACVRAPNVILLKKMTIIDFSKYQINAQFFYSSTIYMLHYAPQHVSISTLLIIRRTNFITTASGIVTLQTAVQYAGGERTAVRSTPAYCTAAYRG